MDYQDGINCINIYSKGMTALGRSLSNFSDCDIEISIGYFQTIEGLVFYLGTFDDKFRYMDGPSCKKKSKITERTVTLPENIFRRLIVEAMWAKIYGDPDLKEALKESTLPFAHYYNYSGNKQFIPKWDWQILEWEKIRQKLKTEGLY